MASLNFSCSDLLSFLNEVTKKKFRKGKNKKFFCGTSKVFKNFSWPINICLKYCMVPTKTLPPLAYLMYGPLKKDQKKDKSSAKSTNKISFGFFFLIS